MDDFLVNLAIVNNETKQVSNFSRVSLVFCQPDATDTRVLYVFRERNVVASFAVSRNIVNFESKLMTYKWRAIVKVREPSMECHIELYDACYTYTKFKKFLTRGFYSEDNLQPKNLYMCLKPDEWKAAVEKDLSVVMELSWTFWYALDCLDLTGRGLTQLPQALCHLRLTELNISDNKISRFSKDWSFIDGTLARCLRKLTVQNNGLKSIPSRVQRCWNLETFDIRGNKVKILPPALFDPSKPLGKFKGREMPNIVFTGYDYKYVTCMNIASHGLVAVFQAENLRLEPPSLLNASFRALWKNVGSNTKDFHNWFFLTPGLIPESLRGYFDMYSCCPECGGRGVLFKQKWCNIPANLLAHNVTVEKMRLPELAAIKLTVPFCHYC